MAKLEADNAPEVRITRDEADRQQFDALALRNKDPNKQYRWARKKDINIARHKFHGYSVVDSTTDQVRSVLDDSTRMKKGEDVSTAIEASDMILMSIPKEKYEQLIRERNEKIKRHTRGVSSTFKSEVSRIAGPGIAYEEHSDNNEMRGMSDKAAREYEREKEHELAKRR